jgi:hypothetical protein
MAVDHERRRSAKRITHGEHAIEPGANPASMGVVAASSAMTPSNGASLIAR